MYCSVAVLLLAASAQATPARPSSPFPVPQVLRPNVAFWTRVFAQLDSNSGMLHDATHVAIVYHTLTNLPDDARRRRTVVDAHRQRYQAALHKLAKGVRSDLTPHEKRVLALFKDDPSPERLRQAAENIRFQQGLSDRFQRGMQRSGAYMPVIRRTFAAAGLPAELGLLPHVESSFNNAAYSKYGAAGMWQFMRSTGQRFLRINSIIDERLDFRKATEAAARLLREHYQDLGTWPLAITAYNHGVAGMRRAVESVGTRDFGTIVQRYDGRTFKFASKNFYAEFLAVVDIAKEHQKYFPRLTFAAPVSEHALTTDAYVDIRTLARYLQVPADDLAAWNPALRRPVLQSQRLIPKGYTLYVPTSRMHQDTLQARLQRVPQTKKFAQQARDKHYRVQRGDTLGAIARRQGTTVATLLKLNKLKRANLIRAGQLLILPGAVYPDVAAAPQQSEKVAQAARDTRYRVQRGDTLGAIARRQGTTVATLLKLNKLKRADLIRAGQVLALPVGESPAVVVASQAAKTASAAEQSRSTPAAEPRIESPQSLPLLAAVAPVASAVEALESEDYTLPLEMWLRVKDATIRVVASETLELYASWLKVPVRRLRTLNRLSPRRGLSIGAKLRLDFSLVATADFTRQRLQHHHRIEQDFLRTHSVDGVIIHTMQPGETLWALASRQYEVPMWLLQRYNHSLEFHSLPPGTRLRIPQIVEKTS